MPPIIAAARQSQAGLNNENADIRGSSSNLLKVPEEKAVGPKRWKSLTGMFHSKKKSSPSLRQTSFAINIDTANRVPYDIGDLTDSDFTQSSFYSPELAEIVSSGGRSKRWAFCLGPTPVVRLELEHDNQFFPDRNDRDKGEMADRSTEEEGARRPTLYLILDPDQDPSCSSEVIMLVGTKEELRRRFLPPCIADQQLPEDVHRLYQSGKSRLE